jgi:hypothetical protein
VFWKVRESRKSAISSSPLYPFPPSFSVSSGNSMRLSSAGRSADKTATETRNWTEGLTSAPPTALVIVKPALTFQEPHVRMGCSTGRVRVVDGVYRNRHKVSHNLLSASPLAELTIPTLPSSLRTLRANSRWHSMSLSALDWREKQRS